MAIECGAKNLYKAYGVPSLDLTFADKKSLVDRISGNNLITFTRASTATYVGADGLIQTAATNVARFDHNPTTGESLGLLVEEARTNLLTYSQDLTTWNPTNLSVSNNVSTAPDGTTTADKITPSTSDAVHNIYPANDVSSIAGTYTVSIFAKADGYNFLYVGLDGSSNGGVFPGGAGFSLLDGSYQLANNTVSASSQQLGNGWYRLSVTGTSSSTVTAGPYVAIATGKAFSNVYFAGDGTSGVLVWGMQFEAGYFPTSYIPTTTATVTRAADVASITGTNFSSWYNQSAGSIFVKSSSAQIAVNNYHGVFTLSDNSPVEMIESYARTDYHLFVNVGGTRQALLDAGAYTDNVPSKLAVGFAANSFAASLDGGAVATDLSGAMPTVNRLYIANTRDGSGPLNGPIARLTYYPVRLPDATLQAITQ